MDVQTRACSRRKCRNRYSVYDAMTDEITAAIDSGELPRAAHRSPVDNAIVCGPCWDQETAKLATAAEEA